MSLLPNIVEVADSHGLDCNFKTRGKKEVMFKCPFCHADSNKNRFYLSLNEDKNVFKCWHCKESGGRVEIHIITGW
ncbi:hypothetical protein [Gracilibacillus boraciitolerans]|uniref:hypothetical protein n=1 Tax=Gracilibacillus boraciitolerans TaxID=307521 RepID=UPI00054D0B7C|nr:hypothetical protein [Gracilibacillus boraciitolerans]